MRHCTRPSLGTAWIGRSRTTSGTDTTCARRSFNSAYMSLADLILCFFRASSSTFRDWRRRCVRRSVRQISIFSLSTHHALRVLMCEWRCSVMSASSVSVDPVDYRRGCFTLPLTPFSLTTPFKPFVHHFAGSQSNPRTLSHYLGEVAVVV